MGRGKSEETVDSQFSHLLGTRRGSNRPDTTQYPVEYLEELIKPKDIKWHNGTPIEDYYAFQELYDAGVTPGSPLYPELVKNVSLSILGTGANSSPHMIPSPRVPPLARLLVENDEKFLAGPARLVIEALVHHIRRGRLGSYQTQSLIQRLQGHHSPSFRPLFEAVISDDSLKHHPDLLNWERMVTILGSLEQGSAEALDDELRPFCNLVAQRLQQDKSSRMEYEYAARIVAEADQERLEYMTGLAAGVAQYRERIEQQEKEAKLSYQLGQKVKHALGVS